MSRKYTLKEIDREITGAFYDFDTRIMFGKQKTITELIDSMNAKQYNLFKKYLSYEKRLKTNICKELIRTIITSIIENPERYDFSKLKKDSN